MAIRTVDIIVSDFEQGGFYVNSGGNYSSNTEVRTTSSNKIAIPTMFDTGNILSITVISEGNQWSFGGYNASNSFVDMRPEASGYKESGTIIDISSYTQTRTLRIELHKDGGISPPQEAVLRVAYEDGARWEMTEDGIAIVYAPPLGILGMQKPYPASCWRIDESNGGKPYQELFPDILYYDEPHPPPPPAPSIDPVEFYDEYNAEYLSALRQKHRRYKVRLELLGYYENVVGEITRDLSRGASGQITINNEQITRRSCNLSLINVGKNYLPSPDNPIWFNRKFKLWIGIVTGKHTYWWSYGVFFTVKATCDGNTVNIQGVDKGGALDGTIKTGMLDAENIIKRGTTLTNLVKDTLMWNEFSSPYLRHNTGASSYPVDPIKPIVDTKFDSIITQADITINANDYISTLFSSIAEGYGADAYYNTNGHFVFQTMADGNRIDGYRFMARQWDFSDQDEMYSNASIEFNLDGYNVVTVYTNESTLENVSYTATNNNPTSPLRIDMAGIRRMADVEIPYVNVAQDEMENRCKAYADYLLMKEAMDGQSITFTSPIIPHLDVNRTIGITDKRLNLDDATFIINSITMPLSAESMTINATQMEWLSDDIEGSAV